ncbi:acyl carrier protein [Parabacteroides goldsteinii]|jgi:acyl carrier protein|uniref:acyl carrier protein n=1 Tax=Parabacteroides goldsteinii TaxID=328812 RepID=UPI003AB5545B
MDTVIFNRIKEIAADILKNEKILEATESFDFDECENWDSIHRVSLLTAIEEEYDIIYKVREISSWNTFAELVTLTEKKMV